MTDERTGKIGFTLIQCLDIPRGTPFQRAFGPFGAFGTGGFSEEALEILGKIFDFRYMGSAEYEAGDYARAMATIWAYAGGRKLRHGTLTVPGIRREVYYICRRGEEQAVAHAILKLARGERHVRRPEEMDEVVTRDYVGLHDALRRRPRKPGETAGWLDIVHSYMFFINRTMYRKTLELFAPPKRGT